MRVARTRAVALTTALATVLVGLTTGAAAMAGGGRSDPFPSPGRGVALTWAPAHMSPDSHYTRRQALRLAHRNDVVTAVPYAFRRYAGAMRRANPSLTLLAYSSATTSGADAASALPEEQFAHDADGQRIRSTGFGRYLMEPSDPGWQRTSVKVC